MSRIRRSRYGWHSPTPRHSVVVSASGRARVSRIKRIDLVLDRPFQQLGASMLTVIAARVDADAHYNVTRVVTLCFAIVLVCSGSAAISHDCRNRHPVSSPCSQRNPS